MAIERDHPQTNGDTPQLALTSDSEPVLAELVVHERPPRVWPVLVVGTLFLPIISVAAGLAIAVLGLFELGPEQIAELGPSDFANWMSERVATTSGFVITVVAGQLAALLMIVAAAALSSQPFAVRLGFVHGRLPVLTWPVLASATPFVGWVAGALSNWLGLESHTQEQVETMVSGASGSMKWMVIIAVALLPGMMEEMLFRGYVQRRLLRRFGPFVALPVSTFFFAAMHLEPAHMFATVLLGFWLGLVAWQASSLWPAILCHVMNNFVSIAGVWVFGQSDDVDLNSPPEYVAFIALFGLAFLASMVLLIRYRQRPADF